MCGIAAFDGRGSELSQDARAAWATLLAALSQRGRDSWGVVTHGPERAMLTRRGLGLMPADACQLPGTVGVANTRAEPTTEWVETKRPAHDVQPLTHGATAVAHNGTIANDHELAPTYAIGLTRIDTRVILGMACANLTVEEMHAALVGSYAVAMLRRGRLEVFTNYKPVYRWRVGGAELFSSLPTLPGAEALPLYSRRSPDGVIARLPPYRGQPEHRRTVVIASAGLDSTVVATQLLADGGDVLLLHFSYGCQAEAREAERVQAIAQRLSADHERPVPVRVVQLPTITGSALTDPDAEISLGEAGAEYAHEWVPARNMVFFALALSVAEAEGYNAVALGANLEEAGAYPDNEPDLYARLGAAAPYMVQEGRRMDVLLPVGNLMKHEIVRLGLELGAPLDLTWSCYRGGEQPCGVCGPCYMRRRAFQMNGREDPVAYARPFEEGCR